MVNLNEMFSNRELAIIVWFAIIFVLVILKKEIRKSTFQVAKAFFVKQILSVFFLLAIYTFWVVLILKYFYLWDFTLLKDTLFWFFGFAFMLMFDLEKAKETSFFLKILKDSFKVTVFLEFFLNFYTFSFIVEMIIIPIFTFIFIINLVSESNDKYMPVAKFTKVIIGLLGLVYILYAMNKFIFNNENIFGIHNLNALVLPALLTVLCIPFFYLTALYSNYERLFLRVRFMNEDLQIQRKLKMQILKKANLNLGKLKAIDKNIYGFDLFEVTDINKKEEIH